MTIKKSETKVSTILQLRKELNYYVVPGRKRMLFTPSYASLARGYPYLTPIGVIVFG